MISINKLLGSGSTVDGLKFKAKNPERVEGEIFNPDIPDSSDYQGETQTYDHYYDVMKKPSQPRNGTGYTIGRNDSLINPVMREFQREGHISVKPDDPLNQARTQDFGTEGVKYVLPKSTLVSESYGVDLVVKAHTNYENYKNRFQAQGGAQQAGPQTSAVEAEYLGPPEQRRDIRGPSPKGPWTHYNPVDEEDDEEDDEEYDNGGKIKILNNDTPRGKIY